MNISSINISPRENIWDQICSFWNFLQIGMVSISVFLNLISSFSQIFTGRNIAKCCNILPSPSNPDGMKKVNTEFFLDKFVELLTFYWSTYHKFIKPEITSAALVYHSPRNSHNVNGQYSLNYNTPWNWHNHRVHNNAKEMLLL